MKNISLFIFLLLLSCSSTSQPLNLSDEALLKSDKLIYDNETHFLEAEGNVRIISKDFYIKTNRAYIDIASKKIWADEEIYADNKKEKLLANYLYYDQEKDKILLKDVNLMINDSDFIKAKEIEIENQEKAKIYNASYSPCKICIRQKPLWQINSKQTSIDFKKQEISYRNASFLIGGYHIAYFPFFSHSMPNAPAKTGFLKPEIDKATLKLPFYYHIAPNMDITYTPRFNRKLFIHELEFRHLLENGNYQLDGNFTNSQIATSGPNSSNSIKTIDRFYFNGNGKFHSEFANYGYKYQRVSDKSYLKNYYDDHSSFLKSELYANRLFESAYIDTKLEKYQGLRLKDSSTTDPQILPSVTVRKDLFFENGIDASIKNKSINYIEKDRKNITRNSTSIKLSKEFYSPNGTIGNLAIYDQHDIYKINKITISNNEFNKKEISKNSPEFQSSISTPFLLSSLENTILLEPTAFLVIGKKRPATHNKNIFIDSPNLDINENNIFEASRYSGIDFRENGTRFSYGINKLITNQNFLVSAFIGQLIRSDPNSADSRSNYVGKISITLNDNLNLYYRFQRKDKNFDPYRDEIFANFKIGKLSFYNNLTSLKDVQKYFEYYKLDETGVINKNKIKQNSSFVTYDMTQNLQIFSDIKLDFSNKNKVAILSDGLGFNYKFDCISFLTKISNDYTYDPSRNIKKTRSYTIKLGLKTINM